MRPLAPAGFLSQVDLEAGQNSSEPASKQTGLAQSGIFKSHVPPAPIMPNSALPRTQKQRSNRIHQLDPCSKFAMNCSWWAKGDLNPHVPKDTGT